MSTRQRVTAWSPPGAAYLFCPADRPERFAKAAAAADVVIIDLEDGVAPERRDEARDNILGSNLDPATTIIRVNPVTSLEHERDVAMLTTSAYSTIMLAKTSSADEVAALSHFNVVALCESAEGIAALDEIAACAHVVGLMWGSEDLVASLGGYSSRHEDGSLRDVARYARARTLIAARAHQLVALDTVYLHFEDLDALFLEARDAAAMGFTGTACVHPTQVDVVRRAYSPSAEQFAWAQHVLDVAQGREGVFRVQGLMVDGPVLAQARQIMSRAHQP
ncbi:MAG: CoA ester lyase [Acidimicrobiaceae bacterium]|nr:CoA ester lyase [Acidimicrobiaceae bacterium]